MAYLIAAYGVFWAISFGLILSMALRQRRLRADLQALRHLADEVSTQE